VRTSRIERGRGARGHRSRLSLATAAAEAAPSLARFAFSPPSTPIELSKPMQSRQRLSSLSHHQSPSTIDSRLAHATIKPRHQSRPLHAASESESAAAHRLYCSRRFHTCRQQSGNVTLGACRLQRYGVLPPTPFPCPGRAGKRQAPGAYPHYTYTIKLL
jgi:hypothetical protein